MASILDSIKNAASSVGSSAGIAANRLGVSAARGVKSQIEAVMRDFAGNSQPEMPSGDDSPQDSLQSQSGYTDEYEDTPQSPESDPQADSPSNIQSSLAGAAAKAGAKRLALKAAVKFIPGIGQISTAYDLLPEFVRKNIWLFALGAVLLSCILFAALMNVITTYAANDPLRSGGCVVAAAVTSNEECKADLAEDAVRDLVNRSVPR
jgi:hypothetical protein